MLNVGRRYGLPLPHPPCQAPVAAGRGRGIEGEGAALITAWPTYLRDARNFQLPLFFIPPSLNVGCWMLDVSFLLVRNLSSAVWPSNDYKPSSRFSLSPGERARVRGGRGKLKPETTPLFPLKFMESLHDSRILHWYHEPVRCPAFRRSRKRGTPNGRFMESLLSLFRLHWHHEPAASTWH